MLEGAGYKVENYRKEQNRHEVEKNPNPLAYLETLCKQDFMVLVLSEKYFESPWCMYEAMRVFTQLEKLGIPEDDNQTQRVMVLAFPETKVSREESKQESKGLAGLWTCRWGSQSEGNFAELAGFVSNDDAERLALCLLERWFPKWIARESPIKESAVEALVKEIKDERLQWEAIVQLAKWAWKKGEKIQACRLYLLGMQTGFPSPEEAHNHRETDPELIQIQREAWEMFEG